MLFRESMVVKLNLRRVLKPERAGKGQFCLVLIALTAVTAATGCPGHAPCTVRAPISAKTRVGQ